MSNITKHNFEKHSIISNILKKISISISSEQTRPKLESAFLIINYNPFNNLCTSDYLNQDQLNDFNLVIRNYIKDNQLIFKKDSNSTIKRQIYLASFQEKNIQFKFKYLLSKAFGSNTFESEMFNLKSNSHSATDLSPIYSNIPTSDIDIDIFKSSSSISEKTKSITNDLTIPVKSDLTKIINTTNTTKTNERTNEIITNDSTISIKSNLTNTTTNTTTNTNKSKERTKDTLTNNIKPDYDFIDYIYRKLDYSDEISTKSNLSKVSETPEESETSKVSETPDESEVSEVVDYGKIYLFIDILRNYKQNLKQNPKQNLLSDGFVSKIDELIEKFDTDKLTNDDIKILKLNFKSDIDIILTAVKQIKTSEKQLLKSRKNIEDHKTDDFFILDIDIVDTEINETICSHSFEFDDESACIEYSNIISGIYMKFIKNL